MKNILIDDRSFSEIWADCNELEREGLQSALMKKFKCSDVTIWNWRKGNTTPPSRNDREAIAKIIRTKLKVNVTPETLFPAR